MKVLLNQACLICSKPDADICSREKAYSRSSQTSRWENKSQIHLPRGDELRIFMGEEYRSGVQGKVIGGRKKVKSLLLCASISELHASSWDTCPENGSISVI